MHDVMIPGGTIVDGTGAPVDAGRASMAGPGIAGAAMRRR